MKKVCVLLMWSINTDSRAQRTIREMSNYCLVDVYTITSKNEEVNMCYYNDRVRFYFLSDSNLHCCQNKFIRKVINHTFFYLNHKTVIDCVLNTKNRYDIIYAHDLPAAYPALKISRQYKSEIIYDVHDLYIETINQQFPEQSTWSKNLLYKLTIKTMRFIGREFEKRFMKQVSLLYTVSDSCLDYLKGTYKVKKGVVFRNFPELREIEKSSILKEKLNLQEADKIVLYHGNLGRGRNLEFIVKSAIHLDEGVKLVLIGGGVLKKKLVSISEMQNTEDKVFFLDSLKYEELFSYVTGASLGLMLLNPINKSKEYALANKITEYMACGVVPVVSNHIENKKLIKETNTGFIYTGEKKPKEFGIFVNGCLKAGDDLIEKRIAAVHYYKKEFNWGVEKKRFNDSFIELLNKME